MRKHLKPSQIDLFVRLLRDSQESVLKKRNKSVKRKCAPSVYLFNMYLANQMKALFGIFHTTVSGSSRINYINDNHFGFRDICCNQHHLLNKSDRVNNSVVAYVRTITRILALYIIHTKITKNGKFISSE